MSQAEGREGLCVSVTFDYTMGYRLKRLAYSLQSFLMYCSAIGASGSTTLSSILPEWPAYYRTPSECDT